MALNEAQRQAVRDSIMRIQDPALWNDVAGNKAELRSMLDALDDYFETNANAINQAIPAGPRAKFTASQKAVAVAYIALKRATG